MKNKDLRQIKKVFLFLPVIILFVALLFINCGREKINRKTQIILISVDTLRGDHLSSYGYSRDTSPHLSKLIEDAVYYKQAYPNGCWTMPSHMTMLTGTLPSRHGINRAWQANQDKKYAQLNPAIKMIPEILQSFNIKTKKFAMLPRPLGFSRGYDTDFGGDPFEKDKLFNKLLKELEKSKDEDFFMFIHTWMVHAPYSNSYYLEEGKISREKRDAIDNFRSGRIAGKQFAEFRTFLKENNLYNIEDCLTLYDSGIRYVDRKIGEIIEKTKQLGMYDNLMFIVTSDHGEHFAEHDPKQFYGYHGKDYYEEYIIVPIIIKYPEGSKKGKPKVIDRPVSLVDLVPTILDYYKIKSPAFIQGESLLKSRPGGKYLISEAISLPGIERKMIRVGDLKYIITMDNPDKPGRVNWDAVSARRLFDLKQDPLEKNDLYKNLKYRQICIDFEKMLRKIIKASVSKKFASGETKIDTETIDHLKALGYLE
ncbi:MAG: sulfatase [Candidatus Aminicenantes bacterium]|nr:sulfatase [Candidatus Aminicenantes bacterium]